MILSLCSFCLVPTSSPNKNIGFTAAKLPRYSLTGFCVVAQCSPFCSGRTLSTTQLATALGLVGFSGISTACFCFYAFWWTVNSGVDYSFVVDNELWRNADGTLPRFIAGNVVRKGAVGKKWLKPCRAQKSLMHCCRNSCAMCPFGLFGSVFFPYSILAEEHNTKK